MLPRPRTWLTDGVFFIPPETVRGEAEERAFVQRLHTTLPPGINVGYEGRFWKMLSYKMKNYALLDYDGTLRSKGSALVSRSTEPFGKRFMLQVIAFLLQEDIQGLHDLYVTTYARIVQHDWQVEEFARTETLKATVEHYQAGSWRDQSWLCLPENQLIHTRAEMLNVFFRAWGHQWIYDREELHRRLREAGFESWRDCPPGSSEEPEFCNRERRPDSLLICEALK